MQIRFMHISLIHRSKILRYQFVHGSTVDSTHRRGEEVELMQSQKQGARCLATEKLATAVMLRKFFRRTEKGQKKL